MWGHLGVPKRNLRVSNAHRRPGLVLNNTFLTYPIGVHFPGEEPLPGDIFGPQEPILNSLKGMIGKTVEEAELWLTEVQPKNGKTDVVLVRAMIIDGEPMMGTMDYREDRVNVKVSAGRITEVIDCS
jgi:hypothetical protein